MTTERVDDFLAHHGVKGMKWGVRKSTSSGGSSSSDSTTPKGRKSTESEGAPKGSRARDGRIKKGEVGKVLAKPKQQHSMSDEELRTAINRINMERQYAQLTHKPGKGDAAKKFVTDLLVDIGKQQAKTLLTSVATQQVNKQLEKHGMPVAKGKKKK